MYIDARKFDYSHLGAVDAATAISRDKAFTEQTYRKWFDDKVGAIVSRLWEIDDIGVVEQFGEFVKLIKESEFTYSLGAYQSSIALVGISAEDLCRFFAQISGHSLDTLSQHDRINKLSSLGLIDDATKTSFHDIRRLRNDCLHFNQGFKSKSESDLKADAIDSINKLKHIYGAIIGATAYDQVDPTKLMAIMEAVAREGARGAHDGAVNLDDVLIRTRNIFAEVTGVDLSMNLGNERVLRLSRYTVKDVDLESNPPELTLEDFASGMQVVVDLSEAQIVALEATPLSEGDVVQAALVSVTNGLGMSARWLLATAPVKVI